MIGSKKLVLSVYAVAAVCLALLLSTARPASAGVVAECTCDTVSESVCASGPTGNGS